MSAIEHVLRASEQAPFQRRAAPKWVSAIGPDGFDAATGLALSPTTLGLGERTIGGLGLAFGTTDVSSTEGVILPGISGGITAVMVATPNATTGANNFLFGETAASVGAYNWGFYEVSAGNIRAFVHNGTTGVSTSSSSYAWSALREPTVMVMTYGDGDNNIRLYDRGTLLASEAQTGTIQRNTAAHLSVQRWNSVGASFDLHAAGVLPWRMAESEVLRFFSTPQDAIDTMFVERRIWVPVSAAAGGATASLAQTGATSALSASAYPLVTTALASTGTSGIFVGSASSPAVASLAATGATGALSVSAGTGTSVALDATGASATLSAVVSAPALVALAALGGTGTLSASAWVAASAALAATGSSGTLALSASVAGGSTFDPDTIRRVARSPALTRLVRSPAPARSTDGL